MVEAIESIGKDKEDQTNNFEKYIELVGAQNIQSNLPAGMIETPVKPPATSVSETMEDLNVKDSRSCSLENTAESISGRLVATSTTDSKREALAVDQRQTADKNADSYKRMDDDNDGLENGLDKNPKNRETISREIADQRLKSIKKSMVESTSKRASVDMITSAKRAVDAASTLLGKRKQKGPGDIDVFEHDKKDSDDLVGGILGVE